MEGVIKESSIYPFSLFRCRQFVWIMRDAHMRFKGTCNNKSLGSGSFGSHLD